jgi:hypothetical protein
MKFADFKNNSEILEYFGIKVESCEFFQFHKVKSVAFPRQTRKDIDFAFANRGNTDKEFYACEAFIFPILRDIWKRNPKIKVFSHPQIKYEDLVLIPDYVVTPKDKTGVNTFQKPLLITIEAKNDDFELGWSDAYKQLVVARNLNENEEIPIYAIVSIGSAWQFGKLDKKIIYRHPVTVGIDNPNKLFGILDFIFADCVKTAEKFNLF